MARLSHPNIARIYSLGPHDEPPHFVMEYLEGAPLTKAASRLTFEQKAELMRKVVAGGRVPARAGHHPPRSEAGQHPGGPGPGTQAAGFRTGARSGRAASASRRVGEVAGTPEYLSPEQARGDQALDARSDVFSLGAVLYELLTGAPPFRGDTVADLLRRIREEDPVLPQAARSRHPAGSAEHLSQGPGKRPRAALRIGARDGRRPAAVSGGRSRAGRAGRLCATDRPAKSGSTCSDLESWRHDQIVSDAEYDGIRKRYDRLLEREDAWIMEVAPPHAAAGDPLPGRLDPGRGRGAADLLPVSPRWPERRRCSRPGRRPLPWRGSASARGSAGNYRVAIALPAGVLPAGCRWPCW